MVSQLEDTDRQASRSPRASAFTHAVRPWTRGEASAQHGAGGQGAFFLPATGLGSRRRGKPGCKAGVELGLSGREASILPGLRKEPGPPELLRSPVTHGERLLMGSSGAELESRGAAAPVESPRTRPPDAARGRWKTRAAPPQPHPDRGCLLARPPTTGCGPGMREEGDAAALPGPQFRRPSDRGDKSLQHAARLQCESHPPRHLLQHPRSPN